MRAVSAVLIAVILTLYGFAFAGHKDRWIQTEPGYVAQPAEVSVAGFQGLRTERKARWQDVLPSAASVRLIHDGGERPLGAEVQANPDELRLRPEWLAPGPNLIVLDSTPIVQQMQRPSTLINFLSHHHLFQELKSRMESPKAAEPFRHRALLHQKAIVQVGTQLGQRALQPTGAELELLPLTNPCLSSAGYLVTFRVLARGSPVAGRYVAAVNRAEQLRVVDGVSDDRGEVRLSLASTGRWVVFVASAEPAVGDADSTTHEASLSFDRR